MFVMTDRQVRLELVRRSPVEWAKIEVGNQTAWLTELQLADLAAIIEMLRAVESIKLTRDHI